MLHVDRKKLQAVISHLHMVILYTYFLVQGYISLCKNTVAASFQKWNEKVSFSVSKVKFSIFYDSLEDQLISEGYIGAFISLKKWTFFARISALASKMGQINKIKALYYITW